MNIVEQSMILYYADYLSLKEKQAPVTDNCKYYFIQNSPINAAYICDNQPFYDENNKYYIQAYTEYQQIKNKFGDDGISSFLGEIAFLSSIGVVNAEDILKCIYRYSTLRERKNALYKYRKWKKKQIYTHLIFNEDGEPEREQCTRYVAHAEIPSKTFPLVTYNESMDGRRGILEGSEEIVKEKRLKNFLYEENEEV